MLREDRGWTPGCILMATLALLLLPVAITVVWERSPRWIPLFLITELLGMFVMTVAFVALSRLFPGRPITRRPSQRYLKTSESESRRLTGYPRGFISAGLVGLCFASLIYPFTVAFPGSPAALVVGLLLGPGWFGAAGVVVAGFFAVPLLFYDVVGWLRSLVGARPATSEAWAVVVCSLLEALVRLRVDGDYRRFSRSEIGPTFRRVRGGAGGRPTMGWWCRGGRLSAGRVSRRGGRVGR